MDSLITLAAIAGGLIFALVGLAVMLSRFRLVPEADEAIIITGTTVKATRTDEEGVEEEYFRPKVVVGGGTFIVPIFQKSRVVSLEAIQIPIQRTGQAAMPSKEGIPIQLEGELTVQVDGTNPDQVVLASQKLGAKNPSEMAEMVTTKTDKIVSAALRTAVFEFGLRELNAHKEKFELRVHQLLQKDLAQMGITLTAVSLPVVTQGSFSNTEGDLFDAEGQRAVAEAVEAARTATNDIEQENRIARARRDREAKEKELVIQREVAEKVADQSSAVATYEARLAREQEEAVLKESQAIAVAQATQEREIAEAQAKEAKLAEQAEIEKLEALAIRRAQAEAAQAVEEQLSQEKSRTAEIARERNVQTAAIEKDKALKVAGEEREQRIAEAEIAKQVAVANKNEEKAAAEAARATAEALQRKAEEAVITVQQTAAADRRRQIVEIQAQEEAEKDKIEASKEAFVTTKLAEGKRDAAAMTAEAEKARATGEADARRADAQGQADAKRLVAKGDADELTTRAQAEFDAATQQAEARTKLAAAKLEEGKAAAESRQLMVEAENQIAEHLILRDVAIEFIKVLPETAREVMAPVGKMAEGTTVLKIDGLGGEGGESLPQMALGTGMALTGILPVINQVMQAALQNEDVKQIASGAMGVATTALAQTAQAAKGETSDE